ncbi:MAG: hypothetical protein JWQ89_735 [Devosia sp.]|uniref:hypothetical protein n=1 Tax=Devosia sp. TaxID=1871048 RepID=UPI002636076E|nr:hypothetical protein [Devosia sp.]MDB5539008.1 hypothetical protein [Devosia sp.]
MAHVRNATETPGTQFRPTSAEEIIVRMHEILGSYLAPDTGQTPAATLQQIIDVLDGPEAIEIYENVTARREGGYRAGEQPH